MTDTTANSRLLRVPRESGAIAVEVQGTGPLVLCLPGMGESRASFRHLTPGLLAAGHRVAAMDLRGHGDSSTGFRAHDDAAAAGDALAVLETIGGGPAVLIGSSMGAAAAVLAAVERPEAVDSLVLLGPFLRDHGSTAKRMLLRLALLRPWGPAAWDAFYRSLFGRTRPADHEEHTARALALLRRPGRWRAFQATARTSHALAEAALPRVAAETLVIMGERDPDFPEPEAEAAWAARALRGGYRMVPGAGHYPMAERPQEVLAAMEPLLNRGRARRAAHG